MFKKLMFISVFVSGLTMSLGLFAFNYEYEAEEVTATIKVTPVTDFTIVKNLAQSKKSPILIEFSTPWCGYCKSLEENVLEPMIKSGEYVDNLVLRKLQVDDSSEVIAFDGSKQAAVDLAVKYNIDFYPTMIFFDSNGKEIDRIVGLTILDFAGAEVDKILEQALKKTRSNS